MTPEGMRPVGPRTTVVRQWEDIPENDVPTDAELLAWFDRKGAAGELDSDRARQSARDIRRRAAAGYHDGSLPDLGEYQPVYFVPEE